VHYTRILYNILCIIWILLIWILLFGLSFDKSDRKGDKKNLTKVDYKIDKTNSTK